MFSMLLATTKKKKKLHLMLTCEILFNTQKQFHICMPSTYNHYLATRNMTVRLTSRWKFVFIVMFKSGTQKGLRDLVQEAGKIWTTGICEQLQIKTLGRKKEDCRLNTSTLQQQTPSNVSLRHQLGTLVIWQWWHQWKRPWRKGFVSFETISPLYIVPSPPVTWK